MPRRRGTIKIRFDRSRGFDYRCLSIRVLPPRHVSSDSLYVPFFVDLLNNGKDTKVGQKSRLCLLKRVASLDRGNRKYRRLSTRMLEG